MEPAVRRARRHQHLGWNKQRLERRKLKLGSSTPLSKIAQNSI
jgi:hypothetical protein